MDSYAGFKVITEKYEPTKRIVIAEVEDKDGKLIGHLELEEGKKDVHFVPLAGQAL
jgi:hypothetical protein